MTDAAMPRVEAADREPSRRRPAVSYEVLPFADAEDQVLRHVPVEVPLTVTCTAGRGLEPTLALCEKLTRRGYAASPHLVARLVVDSVHLDDLLDRLEAASIHGLFVVAGDLDEPVGTFAGAPELLAAIEATGRRFSHVGIAGYPEGHPLISGELLWESLETKARHASYVVTQMCFDPKATLAWARQVQRRNLALPVHVGIPGAVSRQRLVRVAAGLGLGASARYLRKQHSLLGRFLRPGGFDPRKLVKGLSRGFDDPALELTGIHVFTFNELEKTERWRREWLA